MMAASNSSPPSWLRRASLAGILNSGLVIALAGTGFGYFNERSKNVAATVQAQELAVRAQDLTRINAFQDSGVAVDQAFVAFESALKKHNGVDATRETFFKRAREHASQANELRTLIGAAETDGHLDALNELQNYIREQSDFSSYGQVRSALSAFIVTRNAAVNSAKNRPLRSAQG